MSNIKLVHSGGNSVSLTTPTSNPASNITFKLPQSDGSAGQVLMTDGNGNLSWVTLPSSGLTVAQQFRTTATTATNNSTVVFDSNWEKVDDNAAGSLGSFVLPTSGIFTFPTTGIYLVTFTSYFEDSGYNTSAQIQIQATINNSDYDTFSATSFGTNYDQSGYNYQSGHVSALIDVTDVTQVKVRFRAYSNSTVSWDGSSTQSRTAATFIRLGDT